MKLVTKICKTPQGWYISASTPSGVLVNSFRLEDTSVIVDGINTCIDFTDSTGATYNIVDANRYMDILDGGVILQDIIERAVMFYNANCTGEVLHGFLTDQLETFHLMWDSVINLGVRRGYLTPQQNLEGAA